MPLFLECKMNYQRIYDQLIDRARNREFINGYVERHHIIPTCIGGTDEVSNLVNLTPEEHYLAHQLLLKLYPNNGKLIYACHMMSLNVHGRRFNNKLYGWIRRKYIIEIKKTHEKMSIDRKGEGNPYAKAVIVDDVEYVSKRDAAEKLGLSYHLLVQRVNNPRYHNYYNKGEVKNKLPECGNHIIYVAIFTDRIINDIKPYYYLGYLCDCYYNENTKQLVTMNRNKTYNYNAVFNENSNSYLNSVKGEIVELYPLYYSNSKLECESDLDKIKTIYDAYADLRFHYKEIGANKEWNLYWHIDKKEGRRLPSNHPKVLSGEWYTPTYLEEHKPPKEETCPFCHKTQLSTPSFRRYHFGNCNAYTWPRLYQCIHCEKGFRSDSDLAKHVKRGCKSDPTYIVTIYHCIHCNNSTNDSTSHFRFHGDNCRFNKDSDREPYICRYCSSSFTTEMAFKEHYDKCKNEYETNIKLEESSSLSNADYKRLLSHRKYSEQTKTTNIVVIDGVEYESVENASKKLNIPLRSINNRILNPEYVNYNYKGIPYKMTCIYCGELAKTPYLYKKYHGENCIKGYKK